jgi:hypothetical protein
MTRRRTTEGLLPQPSNAELIAMYERKTGQKIETPRLIEMPMFIRTEDRMIKTEALIAGSEAPRSLYHSSRAPR